MTCYCRECPPASGSVLKFSNKQNGGSAESPDQEHQRRLESRRPGSSWRGRRPPATAGGQREFLRGHQSCLEWREPCGYVSPRCRARQQQWQQQRRFARTGREKQIPEFVFDEENEQQRRGGQECKRRQALPRHSFAAPPSARHRHSSAGQSGRHLVGIQQQLPFGR
jgi:hypothetical protein